MNDTPPRPRLRRLALRTLHVGPEVRAIGDAAVVCRRVVKMEVVTDLRATVEPREFAAPHCPACAWASDLCDCPPPLPPVEALLPLWRRYVDESRGIDRVMDAETEGSGLG